MKIFKFLAVLFIIAILPVFSFAAWTNPTAAPISGNTEPPINVGPNTVVGGVSTGQYKRGTIGAYEFCLYTTAGAKITPCLGGGGTTPTNFPWVQNGNNINNTNTGNVLINPTGILSAWGTQEKLTVGGNVKAAGFCIGNVCKTEWPGGGAGTVNVNNIGAANTAAGTVGRLSKFTGPTSLGDSSVSETGGVASNYTYTAVSSAPSGITLSTIPSCSCDVSAYDQNCPATTFSRTIREVTVGGYCKESYGYWSRTYIYYRESVVSTPANVAFDNTISIKGGNPQAGVKKVLFTDSATGAASWKTLAEIGIPTGSGDVVAGTPKTNNYLTLWQDATGKKIADSALYQQVVGNQIQICMGTGTNKICLGTGVPGTNGTNGLNGADGTIVKCLATETNKVLKWNGTGWVCGDAPAAGGIKGIIAGNGIAVTPATNQTNQDITVSLSNKPDPAGPVCAANQFLKWDGSKWVCGNAPSADVSGCPTGNQIKVWNGQAWVCAALPAGVTINNTTNASTPLSGTPNTMVKFTGDKTIGDARMTENGTFIQNSIPINTTGGGLIIENRNNDSVPPNQIGRMWFNTSI